MSYEVGLNNKFAVSSKGFFALLVYTLTVCICEFFDLFCFFMKIPQVTVLSRIVICGLMLFSLIKLKRYYQIEKNTNTILSYILCGIIIFVGVVKSLIPDSSMDVSSYHLMVQQPGFEDNVLYNVFPGNFQMFGFRLPDRLFFVFRFILGYRAGTWFNIGLVIIVYFQVIKLIHLLCAKKLLFIRKKLCSKWYSKILSILFFEEILAFSIVMIYDVAMQLGSYMVEIVTIPFALEMLFVLIKASTRIDAVYYSLLTGLLFALKMTNVIYIIPMTIMVIIFTRRNLNIKTVIFCVILGLLPASIYLVYNFSLTGNPVFPYYNTIFKSNYFGIENFKDTRWGPSDVKEIILWPLIILFQNEYKFSEIPNKVSFSFIGMFIAIIYFVLKFDKHNQINKNTKVMFSVVISFILWAITTGYSRYYMVGFVFGGILAVSFYASVLVQRKIYISKIIVFCIFMISFVQPFYSIQNVLMGREWSWRNSWPVETDNVEYLFNDRYLGSDEQREKIDAFVLNIYCYGSIANLINDDVPIVGAWYISRISDQAILDSTNEYINSLFGEEKAIYDIWYRNMDSLNSFEDIMNSKGYYVSEIENLEGDINLSTDFLLVKIENNGKTNYHLNEGEKIEIRDVECFEFDAIIGTNVSYGLYKSPLSYDVYVSDGVTDYLVYSGEIDEAKIEKITLDIDLREYDLNQERYIYFDCVASDGGEIVDMYKFFVLNPNIKYIE